MRSGGEQDEDEELQVLVVDPGSAEWRVGFATDDGPSALFAPSAASESFGLLSEQNWSTAFTELEIEPAEHAILLAEQPGMTDMLREQVARLLFEKFRIRALLAVPGALLTLYAMGWGTLYPSLLTKFEDLGLQICLIPFFLRSSLAIRHRPASA